MNYHALKSIIVSTTLVTQVNAHMEMLPDDTSKVRVLIDGMRSVTFEDVIDVELGMWQVDADAPNGRYRVTWNVSVATASSLALRAEMFNGGADQEHHLQMMVQGSGAKCFIVNDEQRNWQSTRTTIFDAVRYVDMQNACADAQMTLRFDWSFHKIGHDPVWQTRLRNLSVNETDPTELLRAFREPAASGFPPVVLPPAKGINSEVRWQVVDKILTKNGKPFFPIGFVFGTGDKTLGQVRAMGANAVHSVVPWPAAMSGPGIAAAESLVDFSQQLARVGRWGLAVLPMPEGHYVPDWFAAAHPQQDAWPLGADGKKTGGWFPYSIHYEPMRRAMKEFWQALAPIIDREPAVLATITWNEPVYGGNSARPQQFADYRKFAIARYRKWLMTHYETLAQLNAHWGTDYPRWDDIVPPRLPDEISRYAWYDWARWGQIAFADFFQYITDCFHETAPDMWMIHKPTDAPFDGWHCSSGTNYYLMSQSSRHVAGFDGYTSTPAIVALARAGAGDRPVFQLETNSIPPTAAARTPEVVRNWLWNYMVGGLRGMFIFPMSRGQYGLLNDAYCSPQTRPVYAQFVRQVSDYGHILALNDAPAKIAVLHSNDAVLHYPGQRSYYPGPAIGAYHLIKNSHYSVEFLPQEECSLETLSAYEVIVLPSHTILTNEEIESLQKFVDVGGKLLAFSHALEKNEYFEDVDILPTVLGLQRRTSVEGAATVLSKVSAIAPYIKHPFTAQQVERISPDEGRVLAQTSDGHMAAYSTHDDHVVYCAWRSDHLDSARRITEAILREVFNVKQIVRLILPTNFKSAYGHLGTRLIREPGRSGKYHLLIHNSGEDVTLRLDTNVDFRQEHFHIADNSLPLITLSSSHAYLLSQP